jgi:small subunit ribosomal protein S2
LAVVTIKDLLEAGVHFGHKTRRWNPKMKKFIFEARDGIYILDLQKTMEQLQAACNCIRQKVIEGKSVLFVGTKKQAKESIEKAGTDTKMHYVNERWLGGTLTNNTTIRKSIRRLRYLNSLFENGTADELPKKEISAINRERARLHKNLDGIMEMADLPAVLFVVDPKKERIATSEARRLGITIVGIVDTNCDPDNVDYPIPANDDAIKSVSLITSIVAKIIKEALQEREKLGIVIEDKAPETETTEEPPAKSPPPRKPQRRKRAPVKPSSREDTEKTKSPKAKRERKKEGAEPAPVSEKQPAQAETPETETVPKTEATDETPEKKPKTENTPEPEPAPREPGPPTGVPDAESDDAEKPNNPTD